MSYQVLARKWRPKNFQELRGQEHVSRALVNAIESGRLHHAYLFTGTRGVGKTTIARILSKCLNCETNGITATPCGECGSCSEIDEGRFVDLIEVDAASRTKVDDTRELLENVQYRPTRGRYKVYLIDEVHMLSNSSFNALLKTLEEPPEHVIFLLATTDPQKLPVTVLSRCLQFHLKHMDEKTISSHLQFILEQETIDNEPAALSLIAQSAKGSMRDALSLLDQAIAYGQGKVLEEDIRTMLGTIDHKFMARLLEALASRDSVMAIKAVDDMSHYPVDFADALKELLSRLHQIAIFQATQVMLDTAASYIPEFAETFESADLQMYYQLGLHARRDMEWAPTAKQGLEMALLRMLAFQIDTDSGSTGSSSTSTNSTSQNSAPKKKDSVKPATGTAKQAVQPGSSQITQQAISPEPGKPKSESKKTVKDSSSETTEGKQSSESVNEYADYEQFFQQDESDKEDTFSPQEFVQAKPYEATEPEHKATSEAAKANDAQDENDNGGDALASLHSALGLNLNGHADQPEDNSRVKAQDSAENHKETAKSQALPDRLDGEPSAEQNEVLAAESYDSDIERLMQAKTEFDAEPVVDEVPENTSQQPSEADAEVEFIPDLDVPQEAMDWADLVKKLELDGTYHQIAQSSYAVWQSETELTLELTPEQEILLTDSAKANVKSALESFLGKDLSIEWRLTQPKAETPAQIWQHQAKLRLQKACDDLNQHPFSQQLQQQFGAKIDRQSVTYLND